MPAPINLTDQTTDRQLLGLCQAVDLIPKKLLKRDGCAVSVEANGAFDQEMQLLGHRLLRRERLGDARSLTGRCGLLASVHSPSGTRQPAITKAPSSGSSPLVHGR